MPSQLIQARDECAITIRYPAFQSGYKGLTFSPWASGHTYAPENRLDLLSGAYATLGGYSGPTTNATEVSITDQNATRPTKFYRIKITFP